MFRPRRGRWHVPTVGWLAAWAAAALLFYGVGGLHRAPLVFGDKAREAVERMHRATAVVREGRLERGLGLDEQIDPNRTGFIGVEWSPLTTTFGDPVTKRTATDPLWAGAIVHWMRDAGVGPGDVVLASFSGSFPALNTAVWVAADVLGVELIAISSVGASMWGANMPGWTWLDMEQLLHRAGVISGRSVAVSLGGEGDRGPMLDPSGVQLAWQAADASGLPLLGAAHLEQAVAARLAVYEKALAGRQPALYVNVGGAQASQGICLDAHRLSPGLSSAPLVCEGGTRGVMSIMSLAGVPLLNLLNVKELALRVGIPLDGRFVIEDGTAGPKSVYEGGGL